MQYSEPEYSIVYLPGCVCFYFVHYDCKTSLEIGGTTHHMSGKKVEIPRILNIVGSGVSHVWSDVSVDCHSISVVILIVVHYFVSALGRVVIK